MKELILDGSTFATRNDVYDAFFQAVGAPEWHGRNFDALHDSICTGEINAIEVPYCVVIKNRSLVGEGAKKMVDDFIDLLNEFSRIGVPVQVRIDS